MNTRLLMILRVMVATPQTIGAGFGMRGRDALDGDYRRMD